MARVRERERPPCEDMISLASLAVNGSHQILATHRARSGSELVCLNPHSLEHRNKEIRQWIVMVLVEREMLAVLEAASGDYRGQIGSDMGVGVAEICSIKDHGALEQGVTIFTHGF